MVIRFAFSILNRWHTALPPVASTVLSTPSMSNLLMSVCICTSQVCTHLAYPANKTEAVLYRTGTTLLKPCVLNVVGKKYSGLANAFTNAVINLSSCRCSTRCCIKGVSNVVPVFAIPVYSAKPRWNVLDMICAWQ